MKKPVRTLLVMLFLVLGAVAAHGTYVMTVAYESYCVWDWGCWANVFSPDGQWRHEHLAIYDYNGERHEHFSVYWGGCCEP